MRRATHPLPVLAVLAMLSSCTGVSPSPVARTAAPAHPPVANPPPAAGDVWTYEVQASAHATSLAIDARFPAGTLTEFGVSDGAEGMVSNVVVMNGASRTPVSGRGNKWVIASCAAGCRVTYDFALRAMGAASDERSEAEVHGDVVESPPSTWLFHPRSAPEGSRFRFHVTSPPGETFATGLFPVEGAPDTYEGKTTNPLDLPYSAFGPLRRVPINGGHVEVAYLPGAFRDESAVATWLDRSASVVTTYYGQPPIPRALVLVRPVPGNNVGFGSTMGSSGASIDISVGTDITAAKLHDDWVMVHEMIHTALPDIARQHHWLEEGLATYVEPIARTRAGLVTPERTFYDWIDGMPKGQPESGDRGLDRTHTWGRTYWGGALFCFVADVEIRTRTQNQRSLDDALRGILAAGGNISVSWPVEQVLDVGDRATGVPVLRELYARMAPRAERVDLDGMWKRLGVSRSGDRVTFDDRAPLASVRLSMVAPWKSKPAP